MTYEQREYKCDFLNDNDIVESWREKDGDYRRQLVHFGCYQMFRVDLMDISSLDWVSAEDWEKVSDGHGMENLLMAACSNCLAFPARRAAIFQAVGDYFGWDNLDSYPFTEWRCADLWAKWGNLPEGVEEHTEKLFDRLEEFLRRYCHVDGDFDLRDVVEEYESTLPEDEWSGRLWDAYVDPVYAALTCDQINVHAEESMDLFIEVFAKDGIEGWKSRFARV